MITRVDKNNYYLDIAQTVSERGTCIRRNFGSIIVKDDTIVSTGYCGSPRGRKNCSDLGRCKRQELNVPPGERYELCKSVHSEANAIIHASREEMIGSTLYLACIDPNTHKIVGGMSCCSMCRRMIINAGISTVIIRDDNTSYRVVDVEREWVKEDEDD